MIKNIDAANIISAKILPAERNIVKDGDVVVWNGDFFELTKNGLDLNNTFFGIVCDDNEKAETRLICIGGVCEANIEEAAHPDYSFVFFKSGNDKDMSFIATASGLPAGNLIRYLPSKYGKVRGLVNIINNTNYIIT